MKIAILGGGVEGQAVQKYFSAKGDECQIFDKFIPEELDFNALAQYDLVFRSPSVRPPQDLPENWTSITNYFFQHCPCPIIGVTGTKGKGTTCSLISAILSALGHRNYILGNIGNPALDTLDQLTPEDTVVYELSSFQLWDLQQSPHIAVVLRIEPDHLNVHRDFDDYVGAKSNVVRHQTAADTCIYYAENASTRQVAELSAGTRTAYPITEDRTLLDSILDSLAVIGAHNRENAEAALSAVAAYLGQPLPEFLEQHQVELAKALANFHGLPHRIELVRELNGVEYYDDNYSATYPALDVALRTFEDRPTVLIAGGISKGLDFTKTRERIFTAPNLAQAIFIGEIKEELAQCQPKDKYQFADTLGEAVAKARAAAEQLAGDSVVLMSPGAASFDMFKNFKDRGEQFQKIVNGLQ